jgi:hypothetical protein
MCCRELIIADSEEEEEEELAALRCVSASQAVVDVVLREAGSDHSSGGGGCGGGRACAAGQQAASWQDCVVLRGAAQLTLLLPRDARGELGLDTRCFPLGPLRQLSAGQLLWLVHAYYEEQVCLPGCCGCVVCWLGGLQHTAAEHAGTDGWSLHGPPPNLACCAPQIGIQEQLQLLQGIPEAEGAAAVLRPAFLELAAVPRGALLGARCSLEGLRKASREPAGSVYELQLGC